MLLPLLTVIVRSHYINLSIFISFAETEKRWLSFPLTSGSCSSAGKSNQNNTIPIHPLFGKQHTHSKVLTNHTIADAQPWGKQLCLDLLTRTGSLNSWNTQSSTKTDFFIFCKVWIQLHKEFLDYMLPVNLLNIVQHLTCFSLTLKLQVKLPQLHLTYSVEGFRLLTKHVIQWPNTYNIQNCKLLVMKNMMSPIRLKTELN